MEKEERLQEIKNSYEHQIELLFTDFKTFGIETCGYHIRIEYAPSNGFNAFLAVSYADIFAHNPKSFKGKSLIIPSTICKNLITEVVKFIYEVENE